MADVLLAQPVQRLRRHGLRGMPLRTSPTTSPSMAQCWSAQIHFDRLEGGIGRFEPQQVSLAAVIFDGRFIAQARDDDLAVARPARCGGRARMSRSWMSASSMLCAVHAQQEIGARTEQRRDRAAVHPRCCRAPASARRPRPGRTAPADAPARMRTAAERMPRDDAGLERDEPLGCRARAGADRCPGDCAISSHWARSARVGGRPWRCRNCSIISSI